MDLLQNGFAARYAAAVAAKPSAKKIRIGRLYLSGTDPQIDKAVDEALAQGQFQVIALNQAFKAKWDQAETDAAIGGSRGLDQRSKILRQVRRERQDQGNNHLGSIPIHGELPESLGKKSEVAARPWSSF
jgi:hypothetical protein